MKKKLLILLAAATAWGSAAGLSAVDTNSITTDLNGIIARVNEKLEQGKNTRSDLAGNLKEYDALYARHKGEKSEAAVQILLAKANLFVQVLNDPEKAAEVIKQIKQDFPDAQINGNTDNLIETLGKAAEKKNIQGSLAMGSPFPDFNEKDVNGKPLAIADFKGKVVLIDFWATWCPPCRGEIPNVVATYQKYHGKGFEVIGVSLDQDRQKLLDYTRQQNMTWQQYFDGQGWGNKLAAKYGIESIPATYLLDGNGKIIGQDLRGEALEAAVAKALANN